MHTHAHMHAHARAHTHTHTLLDSLLAADIGEVPGLGLGPIFVVKVFQQVWWLISRWTTLGCGYSGHLAVDGRVGYRSTGQATWGLV